MERRTWTGDDLRELARRTGLSLGELAALLNVDRTTVTRWSDREVPARYGAWLDELELAQDARGEAQLAYSLVGFRVRTSRGAGVGADIPGAWHAIFYYSRGPLGRSEV